MALAIPEMCSSKKLVPEFRFYFGLARCACAEGECHTASVECTACALTVMIFHNDWAVEISFGVVYVKNRVRKHWIRENIFYSRVNCNLWVNFARMC